MKCQPNFFVIFLCFQEKDAKFVGATIRGFS